MKWKCQAHSRVWLLRPHGLWPVRLLCPWNSPGKNTGVGSHSLLQGIFPTQGLNLDLLCCRQILYCLSHQESSNKRIVWTNLCPTFDNPDEMDQFLERYSLPKLTDQTDYMIKSMCIEEDNNHLSKQSTSCRCVHW